MFSEVAALVQYPEKQGTPCLPFLDRGFAGLRSFLDRGLSGSGSFSDRGFSGPGSFPDRGLSGPRSFSDRGLSGSGSFSDREFCSWVIRQGLAFYRPWVICSYLRDNCLSLSHSG